MSRLYILEIKPLSVASFTNIFSQSIGCLFGLLQFPLLSSSYFLSSLFVSGTGAVTGDGDKIHASCLPSAHSLVWKVIKPVITVLWGEYNNGASTKYSEAPSRGIEPNLGSAIREGFLEEVRLKLIPKERIGMY